MWTALAIQTDYSTPAAALGRRAHSHRAALTLAAFLVDKVWRSHSSYGEDRDDSFELRSGAMRSSKEPSRFFSVEAVALPNLPQTSRGRERSKKGYAVYVLP